MPQKTQLFDSRAPALRVFRSQSPWDKLRTLAGSFGARTMTTTISQTERGRKTETTQLEERAVGSDPVSTHLALRQGQAFKHLKIQSSVAMAQLAQASRLVFQLFVYMPSLLCSIAGSQRQDTGLPSICL